VNHYLYAIVDRLPGRWRPPAAGIGGASVVPRRLHDLVVLGSLLDLVPPATPRTLALHHDVVATLVDAPATLPFRYGTAVPALQLSDWVAANRARLAAGLAAVRGCVEMTVKLLRLDGAITQQLADRDRAADGAAERELRALAEALAERAAVRQWQYRPSGSAGNVTAAVAFLVPRADVPGFLARIAPVASHATGVAVVPTGPWAPASFAPALDGAAAARPGHDSLVGASRRVG
jgi:surface antigen